MSHRKLTKLIDRQAKVQEDLQDDCSLEENTLPFEAREQRRELDHKGDLHNTFANALRDISAESETEEEAVAMLQQLSADFLERASTKAANPADNRVEAPLIVSFRAVIASILSLGTGADPAPALPRHLRVELEALSEDAAIEVLAILQAKHEWVGSLMTVAEIREELVMVVPEVEDSHIVAVKATEGWQRGITADALEVTQSGLARAVDAALR